MCLYRIRLGSQAVIMLVRPSTGTPRVAMIRSMCGMKRAWGRQKPLAGETLGQAENQTRAACRCSVRRGHTWNQGAIRIGSSRRGDR